MAPVTDERTAKAKQLMEELELSLEHTKRKQAVLTDTISATAALMQEATKRKSELLVQNQLLLALLRKLDASGVKLPECAQGIINAATSLAPQLTDVMDVLAHELLAGATLFADPQCTVTPPDTDSQSDGSSSTSAGKPFVRRPSQLERPAPPGGPGSQGSAQAASRCWTNCD